MGTHWGQMVKEESKTSKGIGEYTKCQAAALTYSSFSMVAVTGITYGILQHKTFHAVPLKTRFLSSALLGSFSAWYLAKTRSRFCQELWMVLDGKKLPNDRTNQINIELEQPELIELEKSK